MLKNVVLIESVMAFTVDSMIVALKIGFWSIRAGKCNNLLDFPIDNKYITFQILLTVVNIR